MRERYDSNDTGRRVKEAKITAEREQNEGGKISKTERERKEKKKKVDLG